MNELKNVFSNQEGKIVVVHFIVLFILLKQPIMLKYIISRPTTS
jgi:hypothetical protein